MKSGAPIFESRVVRIVQEPVHTSNPWLWTILSTVAIATRMFAAFLLPNAEQDGYSYAEIITRWSASLLRGHFRVSDLFDFWLPLFPLTGAVLNILIGNALLAGKILSGL